MHLVVPFVASNKMHGGTYGAEIFTEYKVVPRWKVSGSYSYLQMDLRKDLTSMDPTPDNPGLSSPKHQFYVRSSLDVLRHLDHDFTVRYVDDLSGINIPSYYSVDTHFGYALPQGFGLSIGSQNLLNHQHLEYIPDFINTAPTQVKRSIYGSITWHSE
jgi:iron complex outermembrane receptor protein